MCGRFYLKSEKEKLKKQFSANINKKINSHFNITPSFNCSVIRLENDKKKFVDLKWGLVPSWAKLDIKVTPINAKAETIGVKPFFRSAYKKQRCIVPASGFYEWKGNKGNKKPYAIYPLNDDYFGFAGLWEKNNDLETFTIITTEANELMKSIHHRMPVILEQEDYDNWLEVGSYELLKPSSCEEMGTHIISPAVNKPANNSPDLLNPV